MHQVHFEASNIIAPLLNTTGTGAKARIGALPITATSTRFDLSTYLTAWDDGHFLVLLADGADVYLAFNNADSGTVDPAVTTAGAATVAYCLKNGVEKHLRIPNDYKWLVARTSSGTTTLRVAIASLGPSQNAGEDI
jgi:hypothetical protein